MLRGMSGMELLLNLAWLLLAFPAYSVWRRSRCNHGQYGPNSWQCLFALSCALVMLFPIVSATDDLRALRAEVEESPVSKRSLRQGADKSAASSARLQSPPALVISLFLPALSEASVDVLPVPSPFIATTAPQSAATRAPPASRIA